MTTEDPGKPVAPAEPNAAEPNSAEPAAPAQPAAAQPYGQPALAPYYAPAGYGQPMPPRGLSIASMVCGIVGLVLSVFLLGFLPAVAGVILGHIGMRKEPLAKGFSLTGLITGYVGVAVSLIAFLFTIAAVLLPLWFIGTAASTGYLGS
jgi:hypothetical protein